ncbi:MAG: hypothetical protein AAFR38_10140 [Planctomycetota bacterium]
MCASGGLWLAACSSTPEQGETTERDVPSASLKELLADRHVEDGIAEAVPTPTADEVQAMLERSLAGLGEIESSGSQPAGPTVNQQFASAQPDASADDPTRPRLDLEIPVVEAATPINAGLSSLVDSSAEAESEGVPVEIEITSTGGRVAAAEPEPEPTARELAERAGGDLLDQLVEISYEESSPIPSLWRQTLVSAAIRDLGGQTPEAEIVEGVAGQVPRSIDMTVGLSEAEAKIHEAMERMIDAVAIHANATGTLDPVELGQILAATQADLASVGGLRLTDAALARRVRGLGSYDGFEKNTFLTARKLTLLVYVDMMGFAAGAVDDVRSAEARRRGGGNPVPGFRHTMSIEVQLFHDADGLLAWRQEPKSFTELTRRPLERMYATAVIALPPLSVGSYRLKVVLRDEIGEAADERTIPIDIVADPKLTGR